jgi:AcrR family transcriptional regulator
MTNFKTSEGNVRGEPLRQRVLDAAEDLLRDGKAEFSMRDLAAAARVSFATPFNQFGSKAAIMHALSARRIEEMKRRLTATPLDMGTRKRIELAMDVAVAVMLEEPAVNRVVMGWIGATGADHKQVLAHSTSLWALALGAAEDLPTGNRETISRLLPEQLAFSFRGVLSFWTAGELSDADLGSAAREMASTLLRAFTG